MSKLINALKRLPKRTTALVAIVAAAIIVPAALFAWGPDRPTFTEQNPAPYVTFNSITNNSFYGDERNFTTIKDAANTNDGGWTDSVTAQPGKTYVVRMYVHNNAADNLNLVAENVRASTSIPTTTGKTVPISGFVSADNSNPGKIWDDVELTSDKDFNLAYVPGSATFHNNSVGKAADGVALPDSITTSTGALLGYDKLDGKIPGCYKYSGYVYFEVKPQFGANPDFTTEKLVSKKGENKWVNDYKAQPGETVDYLIEYKNTGDNQQDNVLVKDTLPKDMTYVPGSTVLGNALHPSGIKTNDGITSTGLNIGSYGPNGGAWMIFSAKVPALKDLACGENKLKNVARVTSVGYYKEDDADVTVPKECQPECNYSCDALTVNKIDRTTFKFTTATTEQNATFKKVVYVIRNEQGTEIDRKESTSKTLDYTRTTAGKFTVEALVTFTVNGQEKTVSSANCKKPFEVVEEERKYTCESLTVAKIERTKFTFTTVTSEQNATFKKVTYVVRNEQGTEVDRKESTTKTLDYTRTEVGKYTVEAIVTFTANGEDKTATSANCKKPFEVEKVPETPVYTCDALIVSKISRAEYSFTGKATATGGATIVNYAFDFGDSTPVQTVTNPTDVKHTYAKDSTYTAKLTVTVKVDGVNKTVTDAKCKVTVTVTPEECKPGVPVGHKDCEEKPEECKPGIPVGDERCEEKPEFCTVPGKEHLPKNSPDCKETPVVPPTTTTPTELPKTGASDSIIVLIGAGALIASIGYYIASRRAL